MAYVIPDRVCTLCGGPLGYGNRSGFCRQSPECKRAGHETWRITSDKYKTVDPYIYALYFSDLELLKIGKSTTPVYAMIKTALHAPVKQGLNADESSAALIWTKPGGLREEQFMHAYFAYKYPPPWDYRGSTHSHEWYYVKAVSIDSLLVQLEEVWSLNPSVREQVSA